MRWLKRLSVLVVVVGMMVLAVPNTVHAANVCTWNGSIDSSWSNASNWSNCGGVTPTGSDSVLLDNSFKAGSYTVNLPTGAVSTSITKLTITPDSGNTITLILPSGNTATTPTGLIVGDNTSNTDDIILNDGAILQNSSGASSGNGIEVNGTSNGTVRINNGGKYVHKTPRASGGIAPRLSTVSGTENGYFEYDVPGTASFQITASNANYGNLVLSRTSGAATYTATGSNPLTIRGNLTINSGITFNSSMSGALNLAGTWTNDGTYTTSSQTVTFNGTSAQTVGGSSATTFNNLTINNSNGVTLTTDATVSGVLTLNSDLNTGSHTLTQSGTCSGTGDVIGNVARSDLGTTARCFGNPFNTITLNSGSVPNLTVNLTKSSPAGFSNAIKRTYSLSPDSSGLSATVRLHYLDADLNGNTDTQLNIWHQESGTWTNLGRDGNVDTTNKWVEKSGVTSFSPFTLSSNNAPTAIGLASFKAKLTPTRQVKLKWKTGAELDILGFNVYRQTIGTHKWVKLNAKPINARNVGQVLGATYIRLDKKVQAGTTYLYKLEVLHTDTTSDVSKIVRVTVP